MCCMVVPVCMRTHTPKHTIQRLCCIHILDKQQIKMFIKYAQVIYKYFTLFMKVGHLMILGSKKDLELSNEYMYRQNPLSLQLFHKILT